MRVIKASDIKKVIMNGKLKLNMKFYGFVYTIYLKNKKSITVVEKIEYFINHRNRHDVRAIYKNIYNNKTVFTDEWFREKNRNRIAIAKKFDKAFHYYERHGINKIFTSIDEIMEDVCNSNLTLIKNESN